VYTPLPRRMASPWTAGKDGLSPSCCAGPWLRSGFDTRRRYKCRKMSSRSSPLKDPRLAAALGCKVKAQSGRPHAFNSGEKPHLVTLRNHSSVKFLDRKAGLAHGEALLRKRCVCPASVFSENDAARSAAPSACRFRSLWQAAACAPRPLARNPRIARDVFVKRSRQP
jgi:hypothetical protein